NRWAAAATTWNVITVRNSQPGRPSCATPASSASKNGRALAAANPRTGFQEDSAMDTATTSKTNASTAGLRAKITQVEIIPLNIAFRSKHKISAGPARAGVDFVIVRIHTDQGVVGIGETQAWRRHGSSETLASITCAIKDHFTPRLIGKS